MGNRQSVKISITFEKLNRPNQLTYSGISAIFGNGNAKEKSGSKNHSAQRTRPISSPSGTPTTIAAARPSKARHSVSMSGRNIVPSAKSATQRTAISETGGKKNGLIHPPRVITSHLGNKHPTGTMGGAAGAPPRPSFKQGKTGKSSGEAR